MDIILSFATEVAHSERAHNLIKTFAEFLNSEGLTGNFHLTGDYARALRRNCRRDVIEALRQHEIGFHCNHHGAKPFMGEYLNSESWLDGLEMWMGNEIPAMREVEALFDTVPKYYTTEFSKAPQAIHGAYLAGMKINGFVPEIPGRGNGAVWFCNAFAPSVSRLLGVDYMFRDNFDPVEKAKSQFLEQRELLNGMESNLLRMFTHEYRYLHESASTKVMPPYCYKQDNWHYEDLPGAGYFPHMPTEATAAVVERLKKVIRYIAGQPGCRFLSFSQYLSQFKPNRNIWLNRDDLDELALFFSKNLDACTTAGWSVSSAEALGLLNRAVRTHLETGKLPEQVYMRNPLGPLDEFLEISECNTFPTSSLPELLVKTDRQIDDANAIPGIIEHAGEKYGPGQLLNALSKIYLALAGSTKLPEMVEVNNQNLPEIGKDDFFQQKILQHKNNGGNLYPDGFTGERICEFCLRQSWSWKPAIKS